MSDVLTDDERFYTECARNMRKDATKVVQLEALVAIIDRLCAAHDRLEADLAARKELERQLMTSLQLAEADLAAMSFVKETDDDK